MPRLFVYGTLRRDVPNSQFRRRVGTGARFIGNGRTPGRLYDLGRYPGFLEPDPQAGDTDPVRGEVWELGQERLDRLDDYEGCGRGAPEPYPYLRAEREILLEDGRTLSAWVYVYLGRVDPGARIRSGDYREWMAAKRTDVADG